MNLSLAINYVIACPPLHLSEIVGTHLTPWMWQLAVSSAFQSRFVFRRGG